MEEMQFTAMTLMALLALTLAVLLPRRVTHDRVLNHSRWMMVGGTVLLAVQFLLQYTIGFRHMGVTQAVMVNLLFFVPTSWLLNLALLNLQQKQLSRKYDWVPGLAACAMTLILLSVAVASDDRPLLTHSLAVRRAEYGAGIVYCLMQTYYLWRLYQRIRQMGVTLSNYYDQDTDNLLRWMKRSTLLLGLIAVGVPFLIFSSGVLLFAYAVIIFFSIYYVVYSFICYCVSNDSQRVAEAQQNAREVGLGETSDGTTDISTDDLQRTERMVEQWLSTESYLRNGLTMPIVAAELHIQPSLLRAWYQAKGYSFASWLNSLRVEYAKQLMKEHPDWSLDSIAGRCGFTERSYFHKVFKKMTGLTPVQFLQQ